MRMWWRVWSGHVLLGVLVITMIIHALFVLGWVRTGGFGYLLLVLALLILDVGLGILVAWRYNSARDRYRIKNEWKLTQTLYAPTGGHKGSQ